MKKNWYIYVLIALLIGDLIVVLLYHLVGGETFDLDWEMNVPTAYQTIKLAITGLLSLGLIYLNIKRKEAIAWAFLACIFFFLAADEWLQIHERVSYITDTLLLNSFGRVSFSAWVLAFIPLIAIAIVGFYMIYTQVLKLKKYNTKELKVIFLMAIVALVLVPVVEVLSTIGWDFNGPANVWLVTLEEGLEMLGITLFSAVLVRALEINLK